MATCPNMKCFSHVTVDAVGLCKNCSKGLCPQCAMVSANGLSCVGECAKSLEKISEVVSRNVRASTGMWPYVVVAIYGLFGVLFAGWGYATGAPVLIGTGAVFFGGCVAFFIRARLQTKRA